MRAKLERIVLWIFLISLPFQTRIILYQQDWYFSEYKSIALYATDLLILGLALLWIAERKLRFSRPDEVTIFLGTLLVLAGFSAGTLNSSLSWYHWVKLAEGLFLFFYMRSRGVYPILPALITGGVIQASIGLAQFIQQSDLGLSFLGETILRPNLQGVAVFLNDSGEKILRAYGTLPHPNMLAVYLFLALIAWYISFLFQKKPFWSWGIYIFLLFGFFATFARAVIGVWLLAGIIIGIYLWIKNRAQRKQILRVFIVSCIVAVLFGGLFYHDVAGRLTIHLDDESVVLRNYYNKQALNTSEGVNWTGIGIGNFVPWLMEHDPGLRRELYQPVHNVYLLLYAELGLLGILILVALRGVLVWRLWHRRLFIPIAFAASLVVIGAFDHFFWTLQQGIFMWWLSWGVIAHSVKSR